MIRMVMTMRRKPGMSVQAFRDYYESHHRLLGEKYLKPFACRYVRRFLDPLPPRQGCEHEPQYDVLMEIWYPNEDAFQACSKHLAEPQIAREIAEDEARLFDRSSMRAYLTTECESALAP